MRGALVDYLISSHLNSSHLISLTSLVNSADSFVATENQVRPRVGTWRRDPLEAKEERRDVMPWPWPFPETAPAPAPAPSDPFSYPLHRVPSAAEESTQRPASMPLYAPMSGPME